MNLVALCTSGDPRWVDRVVVKIIFSVVLVGMEYSRVLVVELYVSFMQRFFSILTAVYF